MSNYAALKDAVIENNSDAIKGLLCAMPIADQAELFNIAIQNNDFLTIDVFLQWDSTLKDSLSRWIDAVTIANYPLNVLAMLVDHGADLNQPVGETTLLDLIQQRDKNLGVFLEQETKLLQQLRASLMTQRLQPTGETRADQAIDFVTKAAHTAKVSNCRKLYTTIANFNELQKNITPVLMLTKQHDSSIDSEQVKLINEEVDLAYSLYFELPYHYEHSTNLMTRLKAMSQSFLSQGIESPLTQGLMRIIDDYDRISSLPTHSSQSWLINPTAAIKERANVQLESIDGQCSGFAYMMMQAMVVGDFISCEKRIEWMQSIPSHELMDRLQKNRESMLLRHQESKKTGLPIQPSDTELDHLELEAYLQAVAFAQTPDFHPDFGINSQNALKISTVLMSKKLEMEDGLVELNVDTNYYDLANLLTYFHTLRETINTTPTASAYVPFILHGCNHAIVVGYDIRKCRWIFCDANATPPIQHIDSDWLLAAKVITALSLSNQNTIIKIKADAYGTKKQEKTLSAVFEKWRLHPHLRAAHSTQKQHSLCTKMPIFPRGNDSLELALATTNISLTRVALRGKDINAELSNGYTPLMTAIINENITQVHYLINEGADVNKSKTTTLRRIDDKTGENEVLSTPPLEVCVDHNNPDIMTLLLNSGALCDVNVILLGLETRNKIAHLNSFLKNAPPCTKAALFETPLVFGLMKRASSESRLGFLICDEVQEFLPHWIKNQAQLDMWLDLLPPEKQALFLQQMPIELLTSWLTRIDQLLKWLILFPVEKRASFLLQIPIEKLSQLINAYHATLYKLILVLPFEEAALLVHRLFEGNYLPFIREARALEDIIRALPITQRFIFLQQKAIWDNLSQWITNATELNYITLLLPYEQRYLFLQQKAIWDNLSQWITNTSELYYITKHLPDEQRYPFLQQKWIQSILMRCSSNAYYVGEIITLLLAKDVVPFLQNNLSEGTRIACIRFQLPSILRALPKKEIIPFIQQETVQDNLEYYFAEKSDINIADIIACLQKEDIDLFLNQQTIQERLPKWIADPESLCRMLLVLPSEKMSALIRQRDKTEQKYLGWELSILLKQLNDKHQDILVECLIAMPHLLQEIDNQKKVCRIIGEPTLRIDDDLFVKNLVRVIQRQEHTAEGILTRFEQYKDTKDLWLYNKLMQVYQENQTSAQHAACSDLQQLSFFADGVSSSREEARNVGDTKTCCKSNI